MMLRLSDRFFFAFVDYYFIMAVVMMGDDVR